MVIASDLTTLTSKLDQSVNFVYKSTVGYFESRFVRREEDYFICYLSSQSGCDQACRMCHLTATGQNTLVNASFEDFIYQSLAVLDHYDVQAPAKLIHYNFMSRGEPLNNELILTDSARLLDALKAQADDRGLESKFLISTIMPSTLGERALADVFPAIAPEIYYSLYSMNPKFRKRWLPRALPAEEGLERLSAWQEFSGKVPKIHFAFIEGENDSEQDMQEMGEAINAAGLKVNLNIVRYNPHSDRYGRESSIEVIQRNTDMLADLIGAQSVRIVPKVGFDVKASCGMFVSPAELEHADGV